MVAVEGQAPNPVISWLIPQDQPHAEVVYPDPQEPLHEHKLRQDPKGLIMNYKKHSYHSYTHIYFIM